eukprot:Pgem_evm1s13521
MPIDDDGALITSYKGIAVSKNTKVLSDISDAKYDSKNGCGDAEDTFIVNINDYAMGRRFSSNRFSERKFNSDYDGDGSGGGGGGGGGDDDSGGGDSGGGDSGGSDGDN